jgi:hypothetical protein
MTGRIKTINLSGRALVQFDGENNRGWYDVALECLQVVDAPAPKPAAAPSAKPAKSETAAATAKPEAPKPAPADPAAPPQDKGA